MFNAEEKKHLLSLARRAIGHYLETGRILEIGENELPSEKLKERPACFVTLKINGGLRGCIGHLLPVQKLYKDVVENAVAAAFHDPRFPPLAVEELPKTKIEISVLSEPRPLAFSSPEDLIKKLRPGVDGVILKNGRRSAAFLPSVWEELPEPTEFLSHLCLKAGLPASCWREEGARVETYEAEAAEE